MKLKIPDLNEQKKVILKFKNIDQSLTKLAKDIKNFVLNRILSRRNYLA